MSRPALIRRFAPLLAVVAMSLPAAAQTTYTWNGTGPDANWSTAANWTPGVPVSDLTATFLTMAGTTQTTNNLDFSLSANSLTFDATAGAFVINGSAGSVLTLGTGGITIVAGNTTNQQIAASLALGADQTWTNDGTGLLTIAGSLAVGANNLTVSGTGNSTISGSITGSGTLALNSASTLSVTANNATTFTGAISVSGGGTLVFADQTSLGSSAGSGAVTLDGGTLFNTNNGFAGTFLSTQRAVVLNAGGGTFGTASTLIILQTATSITGVGGFTKSGSGVLALAGTATYQGATRVAAGTLRVRGTPDRFPTSTALIVDAGATFDLDSLNQRVGSVTGSGIVNVRTTGSTFTVGDATSTTFAGVVQGAGSLVKQGTGTLTLSGVNTHTGVTTVNAGTLALATGGTTGTGNVNVNSGGVLLGTGSLTGSAVANINNGGTIRGGVAGTTGTLNSTRNININTGGTLRFEASRTGASTADASRLALAGTAGNGILNLNPGAGTFTLNLVNGSSSLTAGETYTLTLATVQNNGDIQFNGTSQSPNAIIDSTRYSLSSTAFGGFDNVMLGLDGTGTALQLTFTPVPEPTTLLGFAAGLLALGRGVSRWRQGAELSTAARS